MSGFDDLRQSLDKVNRLAIEMLDAAIAQPDYDPDFPENPTTWAPVDDYQGPGRECQYCGCDQDHPCALEMPWPGGPCSWHTVKGDFAVCSNPDCVQAYLMDPGAP